MGWGMFTRQRSSAGFNLIELVVVVAIMLTAAAIAIPGLAGTLRAYRAASDARTLSSQIALARMRAANSFTRSRVRLNGNAYLIETQSNAPAPCDTAIWVNETTNAPTGTITPATQGLGHLSSQVQFGAGSVSTAAPPLTGAPSQPANNVIMFNSQGIPVDCSGATVPGYAAYLVNSSNEVYAVTVFPTGKVASWKFISGRWAQI
jgi:prepilin-type N-terminal cleavage/methylation domain-containing protein